MHKTLLLACLLAACGRDAEQKKPDLEKAPALAVDGTQYRYDLSLETTAQVGAADLATQPGTTVTAQSSFGYGLKATAVVSVLRSGPHERQLSLRLEAPVFTPRVSGAEAQFSELATELGQQTVVFTVEDGRNAEMRMRRGIGALTGGILTSVAAAFQTPTLPLSSAREVQERDGTGPYVARYTPGSTPAQVFKQKLRYGPIQLPRATGSNDQPDAFTPQVKSSRTVLRLQHEMPTESTTDEVIASTVLGAPPVESKTSLSLRLQERRAADKADLGALLLETAAYEPGKPFFRAVPRQTFDDVRIDGQTFAQIVAEMERTQRDPRAAEFRKGGDESTIAADEQVVRKSWLAERNRAFRGLTAILRQQPEHIPRALAMIRAEHVIAKPLTDALVSAGSEPCQQGLGELVADPKVSLAVRWQITGSLLRVQHPGPGAVAALERALTEPSLVRSAVYGIGTYARLLREDGKLAEGIRLGDLLTARLRDNKDDELRIHLLRGIANSGHAGAIDVVRPLLDHPDKAVASAAVEALRLMDDPRVDALIATSLSRATSHADVRLAAVSATQPRHPSKPLLTAVSERARQDESPSVRAAAISQLGAWTKEAPEASAVLKAIASNDHEDQRVRDAARQATL